MQSVIHLVSGDESEQETALAIAENLLTDESGSIDDVAVVAQAAAITAITTGSDTGETVASLLEDGVSFSACTNTLEMMDIDESELVDGVEPVPEGAVEVTRLQDEGYAYMRP
jgi:intracellular sulfur oxidation DsrE/DsrF family protein